MPGMLPLGEQTHEELFRARRAPGADQGMLAPFEHRAFAREFAQESPVRAALSLPFAIPAYTAAKAMGMTSARSPASLDEMFAGYHGLAEGMFDRLVPSAHAAPGNKIVRDVSGARAGHAPGTRYEVIENQTGRVVGEYGNYTRARNVRDKLDLEYGAVRYHVKPKAPSGGSNIAAPIPLE